MASTTISPMATSRCAGRVASLLLSASPDVPAVRISRCRDAAIHRVERELDAEGI